MLKICLDHARLEEQAFALRKLIADGALVPRGKMQKIKCLFNKLCNSDPIKNFKLHLERVEKEMQAGIIVQYRQIDAQTGIRWQSALEHNPEVAILAALGVDPRMTNRSISGMPRFWPQVPVESLGAALTLRVPKANIRVINYSKVSGYCSLSILGAQKAYNEPFGLPSVLGSSPITYTTLVVCLEASAEFRKLEVSAAAVSERAMVILKISHQIPKDLGEIVQGFAAYFPYENELDANLATSKGDFSERQLISPTTVPAQVDRQKPWYEVLNRLLESHLL